MRRIYAKQILFPVIITILMCAQLVAQDEQNPNNQLLEMSLEDLLNIEVTTASKKAEKTSDAPGIITTISSEEIKYLGANSLLDVLQRAPSIQPLISHLFGPNSISVRGDLRSLYDNHVLILFNGRPVREGVMGGLNLSVYAGFPIEMVDKIEIIRGPGSVLYGSNAFAGVINIITKNADKSSLNLNATGGSFSTYNGTLTANFIQDEFKSKIGAKFENIEGWNYEAITAKPGSANLPVSIDNTQKNIGIVADMSYKSLTLSALYSSINENILGILPYATYKGKDKFHRGFLNLGYSSKLNESMQLSLNLSYSRVAITINDEALIPPDHHNSSDYLGEVTLNTEIMKDLNFIVGGVIDSRNKYKVGATDPIKEYNQVLFSTYVQSDYRPIEALKLILGAQLNKPEAADWDIVPRVGAIFNVTEDLGVKALYGEAFRSPWPAEQLLSNPAVRGNNNLKPEKIATTDIQVFYSKKSIEASLTYFKSKYYDMIVRVPFQNLQGVITYDNKGELNISGVEFEGKASVSSNIFLTGSATYQKNLDENTTVNYSPNFMAKVGGFVYLHKNLTLGIYNTYFGKPKENKGAKVNPEAKAVDLVSMNINYKLPVSIPLELTIYGQNLLDTDYIFTEFSRGWVNTLPMGPGRSIYAKLSFQL